MGETLLVNVLNFQLSVPNTSWLVVEQSSKPYSFWQVFSMIKSSENLKDLSIFDGTLTGIKSRSNLVRPTFI
jgi:hypothetical protein